MSGTLTRQTQQFQTDNHNRFTGKMASFKPFPFCARASDTLTWLKSIALHLTNFRVECERPLHRENIRVPSAANFLALGPMEGNNPEHNWGNGERIMCYFHWRYLLRVLPLRSELRSMCHSKKWISSRCACPVRAHRLRHFIRYLNIYRKRLIRPQSKCRPIAA